MKKILIISVCVLMACNKGKIPSDYTDSDKLPKAYPDVVDVTVPVNIAPLTFELMQSADDAVMRYSFGDDEIICRGEMRPSIKQWKDMTRKAKGNAITADVYIKKGDEWTHLRPFHIYVSADSIDPWISYRLISPSYVTYEELTLNQRCLENYYESVMADGMLCSSETSGQCVNCHMPQMYNPKRVQFHARQNHGGTLIAYDDRLMKVNMKSDSILSAGVYPAWHPQLNIIAYSTNKTGQSFHARDINKIEVLDAQSDLIVYDVDRNEVTNIENDSTEFECFPAWTPDGRWLYFSSAHFIYKDTALSRDAEGIRRAKEIKYSVYRKSFDPKTRLFSKKELVWDAAAENKSATFPRISPDGKYLLMGVGEWGCFHIWHRDADLWLMDLATHEMGPLKRANSNQCESYHSWSSNSRWIIFSSRRTDGNYTRLFIAHIDKDGKDSKAFELPTADPDYHRQFMKSYNVAEFMRGRVTHTPQEYAAKLKETGLPPVKYVGHLNNK